MLHVGPMRHKVYAETVCSALILHLGYLVGYYSIPPSLDTKSCPPLGDLGFRKRCMTSRTSSKRSLCVSTCRTPLFIPLGHVMCNESATIPRTTEKNIQISVFAIRDSDRWRSALCVLDGRG